MSKEKYEVMIEDGKIVMTDEVAGLIKAAKAMDETIKDLTKRRDAITNAIKTAMDKNKIDVFESADIRIARTSDSTKEEINVEKLKKDGLYSNYVYNVPQKGSLRVTFHKEEKKDG